MQPKRENQPTFFDLALQQRGSANRVLETIAREVDFTAAEARAAATYSEGGRPACRVGVLLRVMILQHLYGLSDPQAEEQLKDRLSFQKFVQLDVHETVPDETMICRFRQRLVQCHLHEELLGLLNTQLEATARAASAPMPRSTPGSGSVRSRRRIFTGPASRRWSVPNILTARCSC